MKKYFFLALCLFGLVILTGGCIDDLVPVSKTAGPAMSEYEFEVFLNDSYYNGVFNPTYTFYLSTNESAKVVSLLENESVIDIIPLEDLSTGDDDLVKNIVILGDFSNNTTATPEQFSEFSLMEEPVDINYTVSVDVVRGQKHVFITFEQPVTGFVAYTMALPMGQDFIYITTPPSVVRFVLPNGYTTGNPLIGKVKPSPDEVYTDEYGRENLVWHNEVTTSGFLSMLGSYSEEDEDEIEPIPKLISIKFYTESAPRDLSIAAVILGIITLVIYLRYRAQRLILRRIRENIENQVANPKKKRKN